MSTLRKTNISIVIPCRNEEDYIHICLKSVKTFLIPKNCNCEILVIDGKSDDKTPKMLKTIAKHEDNIKVLQNAAVHQGPALNKAITVAKGQWIMRLDAHTIYPNDYLIHCYETALKTKAENVGGICITLPGSESYQAQLVQALTTHKFGVGDSGFRISAEEGPRDTVPFGFFKREVFIYNGKFDERLVRAQDYEFNRRIIAQGGTIWLNPKIISKYFNQTSIFKFYRKQFLKEAPYNAYMWYLAPYSFTPRHAITGFFAAGLIGGLALSPFYPKAIGVPFAAVMALYATLAVWSSIQQAIRYKEIRHIFFLPFAFFLYHFIHGLGLLIGLLRLATFTAPVQKIKEPWPGAGFYRVPIHKKT